MSKHWYKPSAKDFDCNHPTQPKQLAQQLAVYTGLSIDNARHVIDKLHHLAHCIDEPETITLFRLQPGKHQKLKVREPLDD